jgi:uncharacterized membrane protein
VRVVAPGSEDPGLHPESGGRVFRPGEIVLTWESCIVEFLNFVFMCAAAYLVWRKPERERLAFGLLVTSVVLMVACFLIASRGSVLPGLNY